MWWPWQKPQAKSSVGHEQRAWFRGCVDGTMDCVDGPEAYQAAMLTLLDALDELDPPPKAKGASPKDADA